MRKTAVFSKSRANAARREHRMIFLLLLAAAVGPCSHRQAVAQPAASARITIDAAKSEGEISPTLYGQFDEFMFQGVKGGLSAELVRDRSFDGVPNSIG